MTAPFTSAIGKIVTGRDVELAALAVLKKWASTYLAEAEAATGRVRGSLPRIRVRGRRQPNLRSGPKISLPAVLLISPGLAAPPRADGNGTYRASFALGIAAIVSTSHMDETAALAKLYCATLRACLLQHQSLEGFAAGVTWADENYDDLPSIDDRSLGAGQAIFVVEVDAISTRWNGPIHPSEPPTPDAAPLPDDPTATAVAVEVHPIPTV
jgi:hypothetical protein